MTSLKYFGTSGIRGRTLIDITPNLAERMARAYKKVVLNKPNSRVVIGRDPRYGAEIIELSVIVGLTASGVSVIRCGIVPTPVLLTYLKHTNSDGAIMITGSHIPPDRIGLIFVESDGSYCSDEVSFNIEQVYEEFENHSDGLLQINSLDDLQGIGKTSVSRDIYEVYEKSLEEIIDLNLLKSKKFKLIIDPGNGTASNFFSKYLKNLGYSVISINDSFLPVSDRLSEPIEDNLSGLLEKMKSNPDLDIGIAFDVDADRATFIIPSKETPRVLTADEIGAVIIKILLEDKETGDIILPINSSNAVEVIMAKYGIKPVYCKIGQPGTIEQVKKVPKPLFSYEESGKFYFLKDKILWTDGILVVLKLLEIIIQKNTNLEELVNSIPKFFSIVDKISLDDESMSKKVKALNNKIKSMKFPDEKERISIDGFRINFNDGFNTWLLIRPSGTEPKIRLMSNSTNLEKCKKVINMGKELIDSLQ